MSKDIASKHAVVHTEETQKNQPLRFAPLPGSTKFHKIRCYLPLTAMHNLGGRTRPSWEEQEEIRKKLRPLQGVHASGRPRELRSYRRAREVLLRMDATGSKTNHLYQRCMSTLKMNTRSPGYCSLVFLMSSMMVFDVGRVSFHFWPLCQWASMNALMPRSNWVQSTTVRLTFEFFLSTVLRGLQKTLKGSSDSVKGPTKDPNADSVSTYF